MGLRGARRGPYEIARAGRRAACLAPRLRACAARAPIADVEAVQAHHRGRVRCASARREVENDDFNRLVPRRGARRPTTSWCCAPTRSTCGRRASRFSRPTSSRRSPRTRRSRAKLVALFNARFDPARGARPRGRAARARATRSSAALERGRQRRRGPHPAPVPGADPGHAAHQLLGARRATGARKPLPVVQVRLRRRCPAARAEADVRDLRVLAALRGRPPARRQGRARRPALVRPPRGLPHRGAGPGEGADGEERRDRAGGLQGRLRAEERAAGRPTARRS